MKIKKLLFSVTIKDCDVDTFTTGGKGGQHRNAKQNGVRITHRASGAVGEHRDGRDQYRNKQDAFRKMAESETFRTWHIMEVARRTGLLEQINEEVEKSMAAHNLKVEYYDAK